MSVSTRKNRKRQSGDERWPKYVPVCGELQALARFWAGVYLDALLYQFCYLVEACPDVAIAARRLEAMADVIGWDLVDDAYAAVEKQKRELMSEKDWRVFTEDTDEHAAVRDRVMAAVVGRSES